MALSDVTGLLGGGGGDPLDIYGDLFTEKQKAALQQRSMGEGLLRMAGAFGKAAQPSRMPTSFLGSLGEAAGAMAGHGDEAADTALKGMKTAEDGAGVQAEAGTHRQSYTDRAGVDRGRHRPSQPGRPASAGGGRGAANAVPAAPPGAPAPAGAPTVPGPGGGGPYAPPPARRCPRRQDRVISARLMRNWVRRRRLRMSVCYRAADPVLPGRARRRRRPAGPPQQQQTGLLPPQDQVVGPDGQPLQGPGILPTMNASLRGCAGRHAPFPSGFGNSTHPSATPGAAGADDWQRVKPLIRKYESGGRNIEQGVVGPQGGYNPSTGTVTGPSSASGYYQMIDPTWRAAARKAGIDTDKYPRAINAPEELQDKAAEALYREQGLKPWAPYNSRLAAATGYQGGGQDDTVIPSGRGIPASALRNVADTGAAPGGARRSGGIHPRPRHHAAGPRRLERAPGDGRRRQPVQIGARYLLQIAGVSGGESQDRGAGQSGRCSQDGSAYRGAKETHRRLRSI